MKRFLILVVVLIAGCGGNPAAPTSPPPAPELRAIIPDVTLGLFDCSAVRWFAPGCGCVDNKIVCVDSGPLAGPEVSQ